MPVFASSVQFRSLEQHCARFTLSTALVSPSVACLTLAATLTLAGLITAVPGEVAFAQTAGGAGGAGVAPGGAGGSFNQPGSDAPVGSNGGGGGGGPTLTGAAQPGGLGDGQGGAGGAGGTNGFDSGSGLFSSSTNYTGGDGSSGVGTLGGGAGGGGAGGSGAILAGTGTFGTTAAISGGAGGNGGDVSSGNGSGGNGGDGGVGLYLSGTTGFTAASGAVILGGDGGDGGYGHGSGSPGSAGNGGIGVYVTGSASLTNAAGAVIGGGGGGYGGSSNGANGNGGVGVYIANSSLFANSGTVIGGDGRTSSALTLPGQGGTGVVLLSGASLLNSALGTVTGGAGGESEDPSVNGAAGGAGVNATSATITNAAGASITGGAGGAPAGLIAGAGGVGIIASNTTVVNAGTIAGGLSGDTTPVQADAISFTGGTNRLTLSIGGTTGTLTGGIGITGALSIDPGTAAGTAVTLSNLIHDVTSAGSVTKIGAGTLVLSGNNTYSGGTTLTAGILQLGVDAVFNTPGNSSSGIVTSAIGTGTLTFNGGTLQAQGAFSERTIANAIQITANGGTIDSGGGFFRITGNITDAPGSSGGELTFESIAVSGEREIDLSGVNTYSGISNIASGTVIVDSATALSSNSAFQVNTGATLTLHGFNGTIASLADGTSGGGVVQNGAASGTATLTITGAAGGTNSFSGVLRDGSGGEGGLGGPVLNIVKNGTSTQILAGTNAYSGTTTVNGGILEVDGSIAPSSMTTVNANAALTGVGTVGNTTIASGGTLQPGNGTPGSSLTVAGNLVFQPGSLYLFQLNPATSTFTNVTGTATLNGAAGAEFSSGSYVTKKYTILTAADGVSGMFSSFDSLGLPSGFKESLSYDNNNAYLNLVLSFGVPTGLNINQQNVANALTNFFNTTGGIPAVFGSLTPAGLTQASGETATGSQQATFDAMNLFMGLLTDPFVAGRGDGVSTTTNVPGYADDQGFGVSAYASKDKPRSQSERDAYAAIYHKAPPIADSFAQRWSVWAAGYGGSQTTQGNAALGSNLATSSVAGTVVGADYRISPFTLAGFAIAGGGTSFNVANGGTGRSDLFQAGAFVRHTVGPAYLSAALAYGWQDVTTNRTVTIAGTDMLQARFNANAWSGRLEGGYRYATPWMGVTPYAAAQFTTFELPAYAEGVLSGANTFALSYAAKSVTDTRSELGLRTDKSYALTDSILTLRGRVAWAHDYDPNRTIGATFQTLPGASFVVNGAAQAHDSALTTASAEIKWINGWSAAATFEGEFSSVTNSYAGKGVVRYAW
jgi:autotransporter-associated beta strand protein